MKTTQILFLASTLSTSLLASSGAYATLTPSDGGKTVFDDDLNIYWLADANYAKTSGYDVDGMMSWYQAQGWIDSLNTAKYLGYNDWRLPTTTDTGTYGCNFSYNGTDCGYNNPGTSEMAHLYYSEFGNKGWYKTSGVPQSGYGLVNDPANPNDESLFTNLQSNFYWSSGYKNGSSHAWNFFTVDGKQYYESKLYPGAYAFAVRPGQVAAVPVPAAAWLMGSGLLGLIGVARRKAA